MEQAEKVAVEAILRRLLLGTQVVGAQWYPFAFAILFARLTASDQQEAGAIMAARVHPSQVTITIESRWAVYPVASDQLPASEKDLPRCELDQQVAALARLAGQDIVSVVLGDKSPHLALGFEGGPLLFMNGHHDAFECWNLTTGEPAPHHWLIVAIPGDELAVFPPAE
jgi:hypothetical protein